MACEDSAASPSELKRFLCQTCKEIPLHWQFWLSFEKKEKSPVWEHYNGQYTHESCNKFLITKEKAITGEKSLICFLGQYFCFSLLFIMNTIGSPDLKQK